MGLRRPTETRRSKWRLSYPWTLLGIAMTLVALTMVGLVAMLIYADKVVSTDMTVCRLTELPPGSREGVFHAMATDATGRVYEFGIASRVLSSKLPLRKGGVYRFGFMNDFDGWKTSMDLSSISLPKDPTPLPCDFLPGG